VRAKSLLGLMAALLALALAACGGSDGSGAGTADAKRVVKPDPTPAASGPPAKRAKPLITNGSRPSKARQVDAPTAETKGAPGTASNPCSLVSHAEARSIVGREIKSQLAPQGPTCIYDSGKTFVTVAIQSTPVTTLTSQSKKVAKVAVAGRKGYCVGQGGGTLLIPLQGGQVLNVGASCPVAARFAAKALARLH
jgi:hypothetical protein